MNDDLILLIRKFNALHPHDPARPIISLRKKIFLEKFEKYSVICSEMGTIAYHENRQMEYLCPLWNYFVQSDEYDREQYLLAQISGEFYFDKYALISNDDMLGPAHRYPGIIRAKHFLCLIPNYYIQGCLKLVCFPLDSPNLEITDQ